MSRLKPISQSLRRLPSVDRVVRELQAFDLPRAAVVEVVRRELAQLRADGGIEENGDESSVLPGMRVALDRLRRSRSRTVINATGVIIHTNLGRAPLGERVVCALAETAANFTNLEFDLHEGERGQRGSYVEHNLAVLCGSQAATAVNNCAAALMIILRTLAPDPPRNQVVISRGELVQIGGGFRIPDILQASGAQLREVGTTNQTTVEDYRAAVNSHTALILKVHHSNFYMGGFVASPTTPQIAGVARSANIPFLEDLGSGAVFDTFLLGGNEHEPTVPETLEAGADLVCFSGDKLLGGPQAGIIAGAGERVAAIKRHPLFRALRCDKLILSALEATVDLLLDDQCGQIPVRLMMQATLDDLRQRAQELVAALDDLAASIETGQGQSQIGGGSLPRTALPSVTISIKPRQGQGSIKDLATRLRLGEPAVIGYIENNSLKLDLRTVFPRQDHLLVAAIRAALGPHPS